MQYGQDFDAFGQHAIIDDIREASQTARAHVLPDNPVHLRKGPNAIKDRRSLSEEIGPKSDFLLLVPFMRHDQIMHSLWPEDQRQSHGDLVKRAFTSSQGMPAWGSASAAARRRSNSRRCHSGMGALPCASIMLSQISPINWMRSGMLMRSIPICCSVGDMFDTPLAAKTHLDEMRIPPASEREKRFAGIIQPVNDYPRILFHRAR